MSKPESGQRYITCNGHHWTVHKVVPDALEVGNYLVQLVHHTEARKEFPLTLDLDSEEWPAWCAEHGTVPAP